MVEEPAPTPLRRRRKKGIPQVDITNEETLATGCSILFATISVVTGRAHWQRTPEECQPIAIPLARIVRDRVPPEAIQTIQRLYDPIALVVGCIIVAGPSILIDYQRARGGTQVNTSPVGDDGPISTNGVSTSHTSASPEANPIPDLLAGYGVAVGRPRTV